ncbi:unnamed protein product [Echinostoma caproni]|uniref:Uncharacterized protein n=1 Tax=Echinostoma caproni TaxID=27848 RepID=A0A183AIM3_9TREM|nr:unnamed protein product [Echinostoma caproni]
MLIRFQETSGTNCVRVTIGGQTDTLCPKGSTTAFSSMSAIDVSADTVTTTTTAAPTTVTPTSTEAPPQMPSGDDGKKGKGTETDQEKSNEMKKGEKENSETEGAASVEKSPRAAAVAGASRLMRPAREAPTSAGSDDVIVYYMLEICVDLANQLKSERKQAKILHDWGFSKIAFVIHGVFGNTPLDSEEEHTGSNHPGIAASQLNRHVESELKAIDDTDQN